MTKTNVDKWLSPSDNENDIRTFNNKIKALETASQVFDDNDSLTVHTLEAVYGQESSFGLADYLEQETRGSTGAVGHFQIEKNTAIDYKMQVTKTNDERFDIDQSSHVAAQYLKDTDNAFRKDTYIYTDNEYGEIYTSTVIDKEERKIFDIASYNIGRTRIAKAQIKAKQDGKDPAKWEDVKQYLIAAGASEDKEKEVLEYVENILSKYEKEFEKKSPANEIFKDKEEAPYPYSPENGRWITKNGRRILIENQGGN